jgi:acyl-homoserine lactone acylase PvdQ
MVKNVKIKRDKNGIPHIESENQEDLYWGLGYAHSWTREIMRIPGFQ